MLALVLIIVSALVLGGSFYIWYDVGGKPTIMIGLLGSIALLYSSRLLSENPLPERAFALPVLMGMLMLGRAIGVLLRSWKAPSLRKIAILWFSLAGLVLSSASAIYLQYAH